MPEDLYDKLTADSLALNTVIGEELKSTTAKKKRSFYLTQTLIPIGDTPKENLQSASIYVGTVALFLILIYIFLLFKKRRRLNKAELQKKPE